MQLEKAKQLQKHISIGRVLLSETVFPQLEAFSGNALYCERGMLPMNKYKTVKEVCDLTGLTRKHLYYFHHEKVVRAVAFANYSVEGNDGYKLYDDAAVEKLQQIALYYQLGLKRDEIKDIMLDPNYDGNTVIDTLLSIEQSKKATIERHIAALEYLKLTGTKNGLLTSLRGMSLKELGETILTLRKTTLSNQGYPNLHKNKADAFAKEFIKLIGELQKLETAERYTKAADNVIDQILSTSKKYLGAEGVPFVLGYFVSAIGLGSAAQELHTKITPEHTQMVIRYFVKHPELYKQLTDILV